jgi:hypothetical protein
VPDVGVREEDAVERAAVRSPATEVRILDEIELPRDVGGGVHQVVASLVRVHQRQRGNIPWVAAGPLAARRVTADLGDATILDGAEHEGVGLTTALEPRGEEPRRSRCQRDRTERSQEIPTGEAHSRIHFAKVFATTGWFT